MASTACCPSSTARARAASAGRAVVHTEYQAPASERVDVARLDASSAGSATSTTAGGARLEVCVGMAPRGFPDTEVLVPTTDRRHPPCTRAVDFGQAAHWSMSYLAGYAPGTAVGHLSWTRAGGGVAFPLAAPTDVRGHDALTLRMAPDPAVRHPVDLTVRVTDAGGRASDVAVSTVSDALTPLPGRQYPLPRTHLRTVHIPLDRLAGVDLARVRRVELRADRATTGAAYVADVSFSRSALGRPAATPLPTVSLAGAPEVVEGDRGTRHARVTATLSRPSTTPVTVTLAAGPLAGAIPGQSAVVPGLARPVVIPAGRTRATLSVPVVGNDRYGEDVAFTASLSWAREALLGPAWLVGVVRDDDEPPQLSVGDATAAEGHLMVLPLELSTPSDRYTSVTVRLADGTAVYGEDYRLPFDAGSGEPLAYAVLEPGQARGGIEVEVLDDDLAEGRETFTAEVVEIFEATLAGRRTRTGTITDDD